MITKKINTIEKFVEFVSKQNYQYHGVTINDNINTCGVCLWIENNKIYIRKIGLNVDIKPINEIKKMVMLAFESNEIVEYTWVAD